MPLYEFLCTKCNEKKEIIVPLGTKSIKCKCGEEAKKIMSASSFKINGYSEKNGYAKK